MGKKGPASRQGVGFDHRKASEETLGKPAQLAGGGLGWFFAAAGIALAGVLLAISLPTSREKPLIVEDGMVEGEPIKYEPVALASDASGERV